MTDYRNRPATLRRRQADFAGYEEGHRRIHRIRPEPDGKRSLDPETTETEGSIRRKRQDDRSPRAFPGAAGRACRIGPRVPRIKCLQPGVAAAVTEVRRVLGYG